MFLYTTEDVPEREAFDHWRYLVSSSFVPMDAQPSEADGPDLSFQGQVDCGDLADIQVAVVGAAPHKVRRTKRLISAAGSECNQLLLPVSGRCLVDQGGRRETLGPSDLMLLDCERPYELDFDVEHRALCFTFQRQRLQLAPEHVAALAGTKLPVREGVGALLAPFLVQLAQLAQGNEIRSPERLTGNVIDLVETLLVERTEAALRNSDAPQRVLLLRIKNDIEARLGAADLTPHDIAATHHISTRYLHKLFENEGVTVSQWIRERRLDHCRRDLLDPGMRRHTVAAIGARWGLRDAAHFSRLFKASFNITPRAYRLTHAGEAMAEIMSANSAPAER